MAPIQTTQTALDTQYARSLISDAMIRVRQASLVKGGDWRVTNLTMLRLSHAREYLRQTPR